MYFVGIIPAIELEKTTLLTVFRFLATLLSTLLVPFTAGSIKSRCTNVRKAIQTCMKLGVGVCMEDGCKACQTTTGLFVASKLDGVESDQKSSLRTQIEKSVK